MAIQLEQYYNKANVFWGKKTSSVGVPYMVHIDQGLAVLEQLSSSTAAKAAFCVHGLLQSDADLADFYRKKRYIGFDETVLFLVLEYRNIANSWLRERGADINPRPTIPLQEIREMLIADKVQNYHNFLINYKGTHKDADELEMYFTNWLEHLGVDYETYKIILEKI